MKPDRKLLDSLTEAIEDLLLTGLTTASPATLEQLEISFREAARTRLLRLGSTLRIAREEIARFTAGADDFSGRRLSFFLNRAWLLARGLRRALDRDDEAALRDLLATPVSEPIDDLEIATLGVMKRHVPGAFCAFEFRLRAVATKQPFVWSCVFPLKPGVDLPPEAFLQVPQKQGFRPAILLESKRVAFRGVRATDQGRILLGEASSVEAGEAVDGDAFLPGFGAAAVGARLEAYRPGPLDLEVDLTEEASFGSWEADDDELHADGLDFQLRLTDDTTRDSFGKEARRKRRRPLFGLVHFELGRLVLQPLAVFAKDKTHWLPIAEGKVSRGELVRALDFN